MDIGAILWPFFWIWIGVAIGFLGVGVLSAVRKDPVLLGNGARQSVLVPVQVEEISLRHIGVNAWDARLLDGSRLIILEASGPILDVALRVVVEESSRMKFVNGVV